MTPSPDARTRKPPGAAYQATYRRTERALPLLIGGLAVAGVLLYLILRHLDSRDVETAAIALAAALVVFMFAVLANTFRVHRWSVGPDGVTVDERPRLPLTGLPRRAVVAYPAIAALHQVESGFDHLLEMVTRDGRRYRMPQAMLANPAGLARPDPDARLDEFAAGIRAAASRAGYDLPTVSQGISFWNTIPGLAFLGVMFVASLAIAGTVGWALWAGMTVQQPRGGAMTAIFLLLPVGAGYLLLKSVRRRRTVRALHKGR